MPNFSVFLFPDSSYITEIDKVGTFFCFFWVEVGLVFFFGGSWAFGVG